jgi:hypothetical protein
MFLWFLAFTSASAREMGVTLNCGELTFHERFTLPGCYAEQISSYLPTLRHSLSAPSSTFKHSKCLKHCATSSVPVTTIYASVQSTDSSICIPRQRLLAFCSLAVDINVLNDHSAVVGSHMAPVRDITALTVASQLTVRSVIPAATHPASCAVGTDPIHWVPILYTGYRSYTLGTESYTLGTESYTLGTDPIHWVPILYTGYRPYTLGTDPIHWVPILYTGYRSYTLGTDPIHWAPILYTGHRCYALGTESFRRVKRPWRGVDHPPHLAPRLK